MYAELSRRVAAGQIDVSHAAAFAVDELHGVPRTHPATNASYLARALKGVPLGEQHVMNSEAVDADAECARIASLLERAGGLDLAVLGIGRNGHLAFNEPGSAFDSHTRPVQLDNVTREPYVAAFGSFEATPELGLTLGMAELLGAREVLLLANGADKAWIVARALEGAVSVDVPASALQGHKDVTVLLDEEAGTGLSADVRNVFRRAQRDTDDVGAA
jgi:glucosamine-6-phosphate deaminase